jgi:hypothetical protein
MSDEQFIAEHGGRLADKHSGYVAPTPVAGDERTAFLVWWCEDVPENLRETWKQSVDEALRDGHANEKCAGAWDAWQARAALAAAPVSVDEEFEALQNWLWRNARDKRPAGRKGLAAWALAALAKGDGHAD